MVTTLVITLAGHARPCRAPFRVSALRHPLGSGSPQVKGDLGGKDNAITRIRGDLVVRLSSGELAGAGE